MTESTTPETPRPDGRPIRVAVIDDDDLVRAGLTMIISSDPMVDVVADAADGTEAVSLVRAHRPDVLLMDVRMPGLDGIAATRAVAALATPPRIVMLTTFDLDEYVFNALQAGASGFLLKDTPPRDLVSAIKVVDQGDAMLSPAVTKRMLGHFAGSNPSRGSSHEALLATLTDRELEVLGAVGAGLSNAQIGAKLFMSEATAKAHISKIFAKLACTNRVQIALIAHDAGLAGPE